MTDFTLDQLIDVKERHADDLLALPGVTGVGVGHPDGDDLALVVFAEHEAALQATTAAPVLQSLQEQGVPVRVVQATFGPLGPLKDAQLTQQVELGNPRLKKMEPMQGGISCGPDKNSLQADWHGTMGLIVTLNGTGQTAMLSNAHVMAYGNPPSNTQVCQPARVDTWVSVDVAGDHLNVVKGNIAFGGMQVGVDAAVATVSNGRTGTVRAISGSGIVTGAGTVALNDRVNKTGITTNVTTGVVRYVRVDVPSGGTTYRNQIGITGDPTQFADAGDSGSVVVKGGGAVVGLLWGGTVEAGVHVTLASPIQAVMHALNFSI
ncbi:hypothetical protein [Deinococcus aquiradiocola]|uniref:Uncharacterized protein n=1 Tax=Deinococcus aquiradiocola TaxID=393059 RepID=A0A917P7L5_9DEIO|nr:hypothetical protein [Deinococcus aquiradiocola]GGJ65574.1 hypothetical protein GCM10008939_06920 [Deinococcus aquiradiocola]